MSAPDKTYLGDSVYVETRDGMLKLTTENGYGAPANTIYLEPEVFDALTVYVAAAILRPSKSGANHES